MGIMVQFKRTLAFLLLMITFLQTDFIYAQGKPVETVSLFNTEQRTLHSEIIGEDYEIYVGLPFGYNPETTKYRVLYVLDANVTFGMVNNIMNLISFEPGNPPTIIVGIGYKTVNDWLQKRSRDYMPSSGAGNFISFVQDELIPFVDSTYSTKSDGRIIYGHSTAGLFGLYSLFTNHELFDGYIITSPSVDEDQGYSMQLGKDFSASNTALPVNVFTSYGLNEKEAFKEAYLNLVGHFNSEKYTGISFTSEAIEATHMESMAPAFVKGIQFINKATSN